MDGKVLHIGKARMVDRPECSHPDIRPWHLGGARYFVRCENCGMASGGYDTPEEALDGTPGNLSRILNPGL